MIQDHFPRDFLRLPLKVGVLHLFEAEPPRVVLLPDEDAQLVAEVEEAFIVWIMSGAHGIGSEVLDLQQIVHHRLIREGAAEVGVILVAAQPADTQRASVEQDAAIPDGDLAEPEAVDEIVECFAVALELRLRGIEHGRFGRPRLYVGKRQFQSKLILSFGQRLGESSLLACNAHAEDDGAGLAEIADRRFDVGAPSSVLRDRRYVDTLQIAVVHFFDCHRARDAAVGHIVIGNVQRALGRETVVRHDGERVFPLRNVLYKDGKGRIGVVVLADERSVEIHVCGMAHALALDAKIPACTKDRLVFAFAAVEPEAGIRFPAARRCDRKALSCVLPRKGGEVPETFCQFLLSADAMRLKCADHIVPLLM